MISDMIQDNACSKAAIQMIYRMENTMAEQLYTIPVNDAFHADCECPLCQMQKTLEEHAIEYTMGPSLSLIHI